ncbi:FMN-dependent NADH-azoreductase [Oceanirhabdus sp. W0125-5]|uniref:FMN-dependent NADH-azoreductase n=1 Tax=Oceanirhabdus sp. W0125-5 TaxID=2999116 RepID=UPI0022F33937|nr:NAD(P)H-dependent oxidoreductase [Oceanirhabdus sp. W0125-5]WBW96709.1 NAD(P)H-dependent oxidoreductase [Oceanirhabdus sp. W0125-5]
MKKLLYITCNSKPENISASKTVGREFINAFLEKNNDFELKEIELYDINIPRLHYKYFKGRNEIVDEQVYDKLSEDEKKEVARIVELAKEFKDADFYVIAAPMWSLLFPAPLKEYLDCIIQQDITIKIEPNDIRGLLDDKCRTMVYIQSSGGPVPWLLERKINHGGTYLKDIFKFLRIKHFHEIFVDNTQFTEEQEHKAVEKGKKEARDLASSL